MSREEDVETRGSKIRGELSNKDASRVEWLLDISPGSSQWLTINLHHTLITESWAEVINGFLGHHNRFSRPCVLRGSSGD